MKNQDFWTERVKKYGHTNWSDICIFAFDQPLRTNIICYLTKKYSAVTDVSGGGILDFGCGEGDHVKALADNYNDIFLFDPCNAVLQKAVNNVPGYSKAIDNYEQLFSLKENFRVILSITVLQHIMEDKELKEALNFFYKHLTENGIIILMESFNKESSSYIRKWNYYDFEHLIKEIGFSVEAAYNFYNPYQNSLFKEYHSKFSVKWLCRFYYHFNWNVTNKLIKTAKKYNSDFTKFLFDFSEEDGSKFLVLKKSKTPN